jgi:hypothetical protein
MPPTKRTPKKGRPVKLEVIPTHSLTDKQFEERKKQDEERSRAYHEALAQDAVEERAEYAREQAERKSFASQWMEEETTSNRRPLKRLGKKTAPDRTPVETPEAAKSWGALKRAQETPVESPRSQRHKSEPVKPSQASSTTKDMKTPTTPRERTTSIKPGNKGAESMDKNSVSTPAKRSNIVPSPTTVAKPTYKNNAPMNKKTVSTPLKQCTRAPSSTTVAKPTNKNNASEPVKKHTPATSMNSNPVSSNSMKRTHSASPTPVYSTASLKRQRPSTTAAVPLSATQRTKAPINHPTATPFKKTKTARDVFGIDRGSAAGLQKKQEESAWKSASKAGAQLAGIAEDEAADPRVLSGIAGMSERPTPM